MEEECQSEEIFFTHGFQLWHIWHLLLLVPPELHWVVQFPVGVPLVVSYRHSIAPAAAVEEEPAIEEEPAVEGEIAVGEEPAVEGETAVREEAAVGKLLFGRIR